jgi:hypothetical protein
MTVRPPAYSGGLDDALSHIVSDDVSGIQKVHAELVCYVCYGDGDVMR